MVHKWPNADELNAKLRHGILERERAMPSRDISNVGGWQSNHDFRLWSGEAGKVCVDQVTAMVNHATSKVYGPRRGKPSVTWGIDAWANVNRQGNYNIPHSHPKSTWSCVYYVDTGDADLNNEKSGVITFLNPNSASSVSFFTETVGDLHGDRGRPSRRPWATNSTFGPSRERCSSFRAISFTLCTHILGSAHEFLLRSIFGRCVNPQFPRRVEIETCAPHLSV